MNSTKSLLTQNLCSNDEDKNKQTCYVIVLQEMLQVKVKQDKVAESGGQRRSKRVVRKGLSKQQTPEGS